MLRLSQVFPALLLAAVIASPALAQPMLQPTVTVSAPVVRLGDIFLEAGARAGDPVAASPAPGARSTYDALWLAGVAREHGLAWQPGSRFDSVTVERASQAINGDAISDRLLQEIATRQPVDNAQLQLDNPGFRLFAPAGQPAALLVDGLTIDTRSGRFSAYVSTGDANAERVRIGGRLIYSTAIPTLNRTILPGETIAQADIGYAPIRNDRLGQGFVMDASGIVGKTPRRPLQAMQPLRPSDLQVPILIKKGDLVTLTLTTPSLQLTSQGKALDDGGMGAAIRIANTKSNRVIDATVTGPNLAVVAMAPQLAAR